MYQKAISYIKSMTDTIPETLLMLGTGWGDVISGMETETVMDYKDIPGFPICTAPGHEGKLYIGRFGEKRVAVMQGRTHCYEGYSMRQIVFPVEVFALLGTRKLIMTNATGAICEDFQPGQLVAVRDHIKLSLESPVFGENAMYLGERFFDMNNAYSENLRQRAGEIAKKCDISLKEGVYAYMGGPQFETPAEIRALKVMGADLVGMSTVPETIAARHSGMEVLTISCVTNMAAGIPSGGMNLDIIAKTAVEGRTMRQKFITVLVNEI